MSSWFEVGTDMYVHLHLDAVFVLTINHNSVEVEAVALTRSVRMKLELYSV